MGSGAQELTGPDLEQGVPLASLEEGTPLLGHALGEAVVLVRVGDDVRAVGASCTHYGGPLAEGLVTGGTIRCPWHHACFDLATGEARGAPALGDLPCFEVHRERDLVQVRTKRGALERRDEHGAPLSADARPNAAHPTSVVLVGAGASGAACAEALRKEGYAGPITMLGAEEPGPVDRPNLSKDYLAGAAPEEWVPLCSRDHWRALRVDLAASDPATAIDTTARTVTTRSGRRLSYGALLYAPGAEPVRLAIDGATQSHVLTLRTFADARAIIERAEPGKRAVVIGASFIGLEVAASLVARGLEVHVVAPESVPLERVLGAEVGAFLRTVHEAKGVRFHLGARPKAIPDGVVELDDGEILPAELVVLGVGVRPRTALAEAAGLAVDDGVLVDASLRASAEGVWAAGDVARFPLARGGGAERAGAASAERARIEHWVLAERQGQTAARAMLGQPVSFRDVPFFWSVHHDVTIAYVGHAPRWDRVTVDGSLAERDAAIAYELGGEVRAVATIGRDRTSLAVEAAMMRGDQAAIARLVRGV